MVLGGGGPAGLAWMTGVLAGLAESGVSLGVDCLIGTSAGAILAAQAGRGVSYAELLRTELDEKRMARELKPVAGAMSEVWAAFSDGAVDPTERRKRVGAAALRLSAVPESARRKMIAARLPEHSWPDHELWITAVDAYSGEFTVFDRNSGVSLVDAVTASSAAPGIWPPVTIGGSRYIDGGVRSQASADLAQSYERVLVLTPWVDESVDAEVDDVLQKSSDVSLISPSDDEQRIFRTKGREIKVRQAAAQSGRMWGQKISDAVAALWDTTTEERG